MSLPSTPTRSGALSAISTPSESQYGDSKQELTPESKVKAMLAAFDSDSDSDHLNRAQESHVNAAATNNAHNLPQTSSSIKRKDSSNDCDGSDGEESDHVPINREKLASLLRGREAVQPINPKESSDTNAYQRVKRKLLLGRTIESGENTADSVQDDSASGEVESNIDSMVHSSQSDPGSDSSHSAAKSSLKGPRLSPKVFLTRNSTAPIESLKKAEIDDDSDSDLPPDPLLSTKFQLLVARKREELQAKKAADAREKAEKKSKLQILSKAGPTRSTELGSRLLGVPDSDSDTQAVESRWTQQARPTRKPTKKEVEETNRETQRMRRNMQWTHQAKTKKKITKESFFTRFNFRTSPQVTGAVRGLSLSTAVTSAPSSDTETINRGESLPTGPDMAIDPSRKCKSLDSFPGENAFLKAEDVQGVLPSSLYVLGSPLPQHQEEHDEQPKGCKNTQDLASITVNSIEPLIRPTKIRRPQLSLRSMIQKFDSDSDLEILPSRKLKQSKLDIFDRLPAHNANSERSLQTLRALAHMNSPGKQNLGSKPSMTMSDMQNSLQQRARKQAAQERAEKIQDLKDRGVIIQTAEERERDQAEVEDLVEKARREAAQVMQQEKQAARKEKLANGELDNMGLTSDDDEDFEDSDAEQSEIDLSGSDEEQDREDEHLSDSEAEEDEEVDDNGGREFSVAGHNSTAARLVDIEASEAGEDEEQVREMHSENDEDICDKESNVLHDKRRQRTHLIIDDDDEADDEAGKDDTKQSPAFSLESPQKLIIPGLPFSNAPPMGLTQAFAATMADTDTQARTQPNENADPDQEQDSLTFLGRMPEPNFPMYEPEESQQLVPDSQNGNLPSDAHCNADRTMSPEIELHFSQDQVQYNLLEASENLPAATQFSEIPDPTQDAGFATTTPIRNRFVSVPPSTIDTVLLSGVARNSPVVKKRGRLHRRAEASGDMGDMSEDDILRHDVISLDAFSIMNNAARKPLRTIDAFDKNKSEAKGMVEEQAQESEDEYAGLGGASDDEGTDEEDEEVRKMIDEGDVKVDERKLAAFYADKERATDEKAVEKLFKNINNGMLRRKRGTEFDLSDSDDDAEARQRAKRREFARMRKALLENENVGKIAHDPKKLPFLRAIEDRDYDSMGFLEQADEPSQLDPDSQQGANLQPQSESGGDSASLARKRPLQDSIPDHANRLPPASRRTRPIKKPFTLADIRKSVSFLIEEPDTLGHRLQPGSSPQSSDDENTRHPREPFASRRRTNPVIDRLSLKRAESSKTASVTSRLAFHDPSSGTGPGGFRVPSLLRRATTSQLPNGTDKHGISTGTAGTERAAGGGEKGDFIRRGGSHKSSIGYFAREKERGTGRVQEVERRRAEGLRKMSMGRVGLSGLSSGTFD